MQKLRPRLLLAPMEGVADWVLRDTLTSMDRGIDQCVTEFLRVTDRLHPHSVFYKNCPELHTGSKTRSGVPVFVQLLGGQAEPMAENAERAAKLGALGIDLNFGCPAKTVNRHDGGASLLKDATRLYKIVKSVREAVPKNIPVTAKIRLGFDDPKSCLENAKAIEEAGATWLTVHCRTKINGYKPPAYWEWIPRIKEVTPIRIVANGDIWSLQELLECQRVTQCSDFMIGRAVMSDPFVFRNIASHFASDFNERSPVGTKQLLSPAQLSSPQLFSPQLSPAQISSSQLAPAASQNFSLGQTRQPELPSTWEESKKLLPLFFQASESFINGHFAVSRTKQWLKGLALKSQEAKAVFDQIKILKNPTEFRQQLEAHCL